MTPRTIVLDANVLMRAVLGRRVDRLLERFASQVTFLAPEVAFDDVHEHLASVLTKRGELNALQPALEKLTKLRLAVRAVEPAEYEAMKPAALVRIGPRDPDDWPIMACALALNCPIWTEDRDFFGTGVATWTTALVELYFTAPDPDPGTAEH
ncbi:MAG: nucleotide-binding protein [Burkholderiaceae bacterium]|nr:nucleotide-binding protein [Burkholderiaceae bacterium]MBX9795245.1 nucleotide-binding protein [Burkholderiaceae bacterium]